MFNHILMLIALYLFTHLVSSGLLVRFILWKCKRIFLSTNSHLIGIKAVSKYLAIKSRTSMNTNEEVST